MHYYFRTSRSSQNLPWDVGFEFFFTLLNDYVLTSFTWYDMDPAELVFQQNNSRVHTANVVQQWLAKQEFTVLEWPANPPDHNIYEHVWGYIMYKLA